MSDVVEWLEDGPSPAQVMARLLEQLSDHELEGWWDEQVGLAEDEADRFPVPRPGTAARARYDTRWSERTALLEAIESEHARRRMTG